MSTQDTDLRAWIGRSETVRDTIGPTPVLALAATLDHPAAPVEPGMPLPPLWHWLYFLPLHRQSETGAAWQRDIVPDEVLLFRYSALTFNGHRIHCDRRYATEVEGYPGVVVHGPLIATLLMDLLHRHLPQAEVVGFKFKAVRPTFDLHPVRINGRLQGDGKTVRLWSQDPEGGLTMDATAVLR